jgi:hypothetical protein
VGPDGGSHPVVDQIVDGKWRIVEILDSTAEVYRVRVEPLAFHTESACPTLRKTETTVSTISQSFWWSRIFAARRPMAELADAAVCMAISWS